jgi:hypothetical protein
MKNDYTIVKRRRRRKKKVKYLRNSSESIYYERELKWNYNRLLFYAEESS